MRHLSPKLSLGLLVGLVCTHSALGCGEEENDRVAGASDALTESGLVGHWKLDETSGTLATDSSGLGNHGTIVGAAASAGKIDGARSFSTSGSHVAIPTLKGFDFGKGTIAFWYKPRYSTRNTAGVAHSMVVVGPDTWTAGRIGVVNNREWDPIRANHMYAAGDVSSRRHLDAGVWVHIAYTWNAAGGEQKVYVDGALDSSRTGTWTPNTTPKAATIGKSANYDDIADGVIDEVRFYNRPLPASEVAALKALSAAAPVAIADAGVTNAIPTPAPTGPVTVSRDASGFATINGQRRFLKLVYDATNNGASYASVTVPARHFERYAWDVVLNYFLGTQDNAIKANDALKPYGAYSVAIGNAMGQWPISSTTDLQLVKDPAFRSRWVAAGGLAAYLSDEPIDAIQSNVLQWQGTYKAAMPGVATISILLQTGFGQAADWASKNTGDWLGIDPYPYMGLESYPLKRDPQASAPSSYGWSLDYIAEGAANLTKQTRKYGKTALVINQLFKGFWGAERLPNRCELWAQAVMPIVEGANGVGWWAFGSSYDGALHSAAVTDSERTPVETELGKITKLLAALEPVILSSPQPTKLVFNSTTHPSGDPKQWRIEALTDYLTVWPAGYDKPFYQLYSDVSWWGSERAALLAGDTSKSYMLDQASYVRTRVFEAADGTGYVFAYNHRPSHYPSVTFRWHRSISRVEDLSTGEVFAVGPDGTSWSAGFGGSSTKRQAGLQTARIFKVSQ